MTFETGVFWRLFFFMVTFPPCKINLGLRVLAKRPDGYHDIETVFYPLPWTDILEVIPSGEFSFATSGNAIPGDTDENICVKAYRLLQRDFQFGGVQAHLHKILPMGAGLGGGSANGAYMLKMLNTVFKLGLDTNELKRYASMLGSDCAFFLEDRPMLGTGRGEVLSPVSVSLAGKYIVVINPGIHVSTAAAYAGVVPAVPKTSLQEIVSLEVKKWKAALVNDFENSVFKSQPVIGEIKESLYALGAVYACMSGSGSSVFGIFDDQVDLPSSLQKYMHWASRLSA